MMSEVMQPEGITERSSSKSDGRIRMRSETRDVPGEFLAWICGQFSTGRGRKVQEKNRDDRRRSAGMDEGENRFLGGSDPTLSGFSSAQRLRRRGSLPPNLPNRVPRSVAGRGACREHNDFESVTAEEMKRWP